MEELRDNLWWVTNGYPVLFYIEENKSFPPFGLVKDASKRTCVEKLQLL